MYKTSAKHDRTGLAKRGKIIYTRPQRLNAVPGRFHPLSSKDALIADPDSLDRRECRRFRVRDGAFAAITDTHGKLGPIHDISLKGLAFRYLADDCPAQAAADLAHVQLLCRQARLRLDGLPAVLVADEALSSGPSFIDLKMRRVALQFGDLDPDQRHRLADFIYQCALAES
jgi:hypothetical protein